MAVRPIARSDSNPAVYDRDDSQTRRYNNITTSVLNNNTGGADIEELLVNSARDGAYHKLKNLISSCTDSSSPLNINVRDKRTGNTALIWACKRAHVKVVQLVLAHGADITLQNHNKESALEVASPLIKQLIINCVDHGEGTYSQRLLHAAWVGDDNIVNDILSSGRMIDVNVRNSDGLTPLLLCTRDVYTLEKLGSQLLKNYQPTTIVNDFIQCGADTSARDSEGKTALHYCASSKASNALPLTALLAKNTEIDVKDRRSLTPLHYACQAGNLAIAKLLVEYGSNVNCKGFGGTTPLHIAAFNNLQQLALLLLEHEANSLALDDKGQTPVDIARNRKFKTLLKSWRETEVALGGEVLAPVTNIASTGQSEDSKWPPRKVGNNESKESSGIKSIQREKTRLLGDMSGSGHKGNNPLGPICSLNKLRDALHTPSTSSTGIRSHSTGTVERRGGNSAHSHSRLSADGGRIPRDSTALEILRLARQTSGSTSRQTSLTDTLNNSSSYRSGLSPVSPYPKLGAIRSPGYGSISPYSNLPDIPSASPPLSTIPENIDSLPRSVMFDTELLRQGLSENSPRNEDIKPDLVQPSPLPALLSRTGSGVCTQPRVNVWEPKASAIKPSTGLKPTAISGKRVGQKSKSGSILQSAAKDNSVRAQKSSTQEKKTSLSYSASGAELRASKEKRAKLSNGKITVYRTDDLPSLLPSTLECSASPPVPKVAEMVRKTSAAKAKVSNDLEKQTHVVRTSTSDNRSSSSPRVATTSSPSVSVSKSKNDTQANQNGTIAKQERENSKPIAKSPSKSQRTFKPTMITKKPTNASEQKTKAVVKDILPLPVNKLPATNTQSKGILNSSVDAQQPTTSTNTGTAGHTTSYSLSQHKPDTDIPSSFNTNEGSPANVSNNYINTKEVSSHHNHPQKLETVPNYHTMEVKPSNPVEFVQTFNPSSQNGSITVSNHLTLFQQPSKTHQPKSVPARAMTYKPLHLLMNSPLADAQTMERSMEGPNELAAPTLAERSVDPATSNRKLSEYQGPIIEDIFENFPRPLYEFAAVVAQDSANQKAAQARKKKRKPTPGKAGDSRASSGVIRGPKANNKKNAKVPKAKKGQKTSSDAKMGDDVQRGNPETSALISGVNWHINAERSADVDYAFEFSDTDGGAATGDDSDGDGLNNFHSTTHRSLSLHDMSPRQRREELKNMLLLMRNSRHHAAIIPRDGSTASLLPETMQVMDVSSGTLAPSSSDGHGVSCSTPLKCAAATAHAACQTDWTMTAGLDIFHPRFDHLYAQRSSSDKVECCAHSAEKQFQSNDISSCNKVNPLSSVEDSDSRVKVEPRTNTEGDDENYSANTADLSYSPEDERDFHKFANVDPEDMNYSHNMSGMFVSDDDANELETVDKDPHRKHIIHQDCLLQLFRMAIQEFVAAVPDEDELTRLFALDTVHFSEKDAVSGEASSDESIPDVSELAMVEGSGDESAMVIEDNDKWHDSESEVEEKIVEELERCVSTAMSDIIDEILTTPAPVSSHDKTSPSPRISTLTPRLSTPLMSVTSSAMSLLNPKSPLTDSLLKEINDQWKQTRQLVGEQEGTEISPTILSRRSSLQIPAVAVSPLLVKRSLSLKDGYVWNHADISKHHHSIGSNRPVVSRLGTPDVRDKDDGQSTERSDHEEDSFQTLTWRKGNVLGKGAYGTVYCGLTNDGHLIAVKQIELNVHDWDKAELEYESIQEEVELLKNLSHENIVGFLGTSLENHVVSIFMQFIPGGTISSLLSRFGAFEERVFQRFTLQIVDGVHYLHQNNIIHRDIKGANIMLMLNGVIKLIDFGCAKRLCFNLSVSQSEILKSMKGTPYWMAPEVIKETGHGCKSDIWSIGCTVFEMATTNPPWSQMERMAAMFAIGSDSKPVPELPDNFSEDARQFVALCLQREPSKRSSATELLQSPFLSSIT